MARLPNPGADGDQWGAVLNDYLSVAHNADGTLKGGGVASLITTADDLIIGAADGTPTRLGKGADNSVLTVDPVTHHLAWDPGIADPTANSGDMLYRDGLGNLAALVVGANGQVLGVVSGLPTWVAAGFPLTGGEITGHLIATGAQDPALLIRKTTSGPDIFLVETNTPKAAFVGGTDVIGYSDQWATEKWRLVGASGEHTGVMAPARAKQTNLSTTTVANTVTESQIVGHTTAATGVLAGTIYRITVSGTLGWVATSGTLTFRVKIAGTTVLTFTFPSQGSAASGQAFELSALLTVRAAGTTAAVAGHGRLQWHNALPVMAASSSGTINTTTTQLIAVTAQWATANASNTLAAMVGLIERLT